MNQELTIDEMINDSNIECVIWIEDAFRSNHDVETIYKGFVKQSV